MMETTLPKLLNCPDCGSEKMLQVNTYSYIWNECDACHWRGEALRVRKFETQSEYKRRITDRFNDEREP
jgi:hypothetical protein